MKFSNRFDGITADEIFNQNIIWKYILKRIIIVALQLKNFHSPDKYIGILRFTFVADKSYEDNVKMLFKIHHFK